MEADEFLIRLDASPGNDLLRLAYADWLEERGDRRGAYLRAAASALAAQADLPSVIQNLSELRPLVQPAWLRRAYPAFAADAVREAVFRTLLGTGLGFDTFAQVEDARDPSPYLLARLAAEYPGVLPVSAAEFRGGVYRDRRTGRSGYMVGIDRLSWEAEAGCAVEGTFFMDGLAAQGNVSRVGVSDGWWAVLDASNLWVS